MAAGGLLFAGVAAALAAWLSPAAAVVIFLALGLVAGLTESAERALVARLAPVRTGRGFGVYHALTGVAALPAGLLFGALYQKLGGARALWASAAGMAARGGPLAGRHHGSENRGEPMTSVWAAVMLLACTRWAHPAEGAGAHPGGGSGARHLLRAARGAPRRHPCRRLRPARPAGTDSRSSSGADSARPSAVTAPWNDAPLALTRLAELRDRGLRRQRGAD